MKKTVLIVDDVPFVRQTLGKILREAHYQVIGEAADGIEAVDLFQKLRPDLITMDLVMPNMSGIDATRRIIKLDKNAKVIIISAMGQENLVMEAINVGAQDYILKPFSEQEVLRTLERMSLVDEKTAMRAQIMREPTKL